MKWLDSIIEKLNPAQPEILQDQGSTADSTINTYTVAHSYENIEVVQRGTNVIVDNAAAIKFDIKEKIPNLAAFQGPINKSKLNLLINFKPNLFQDSDSFFRNIYLDLILEGNAFIYFDGVHLYNLPASNVKIVGDAKTFIKRFEYGGTNFFPTEIIYIKENSSRSIYRGDSRLMSALGSIAALNSMLSFQTNFFENNAIPGLILKTPNVLSEKIKERLLRKWMQSYNPRRGGKKPMIVDGDFSVENLGQTDFRELDFASSVEIHEKKILKALGVPPILLDSGNNANIAPNLKLFYINTILPLVDKVGAAIEFFFGYDLKANKHDILALRPELREEANFYTSFVNAGILTRNEARASLRYESSNEEIADRLILPANIAGSAADPSIGGKPKQPEEN